MDRATGIFVDGIGAAAATSGVLTQPRRRPLHAAARRFHSPLLGQPSRGPAARPPRRGLPRAPDRHHALLPPCRSAASVRSPFSLG